VDPHVESFLYQGERLRTTPYAQLRPEEFDVIVILTDHSSFDWERLLPYKDRIVDARGVLRKLLPSPAVADASATTAAR